MFRYTLVEGDFWLPDIGPYHSFGLQAGSLERGAYTVRFGIVWWMEKCFGRRYDRCSKYITREEKP